MTLWIFQMFFNLIMAGVAIVWFMGRRQTRSEQSRSSQAPVTMALPEPAAPATPINTPLGSITSTLSERQAPELRPNPASASSFDAYEKADLLISRGVPLKEVARLTGLSFAELQLLGKMSQKSQ